MEAQTEKLLGWMILHVVPRSCANGGEEWHAHVSYECTPLYV